jgi:hypothetical protein
MDLHEKKHIYDFKISLCGENNISHENSWKKKTFKKNIFSHLFDCHGFYFC